MTDSTASATSAAPIGLAALENTFRQHQSWLCKPARNWTPEHLEADGQPLLDVAIIGGGMAGLTLSAALKHQGVRVAAFDQAPEGYEGPWATTARMETLRSPKELTGPALGQPTLTFRAWFEAQFGLDAWNALDKIPRLQWMDYLRWYRQVLKLDVRNRQRLVGLTPAADAPATLSLVDESAATPRPYTIRARHVVIATGRDGLGGPWVPDWAHTLPAGSWHHSGHDYDPATLAGLDIAVIGGGASAMDSAASALEAGARSARLLVRRPDLPRINKGKGAGHPGIVHGYSSFPDDWKWRWRHYINAQQVPPPQGSTLRVSRHANAHFHFGVPVLSASQRADGRLRLDTPQGPLAVDRVIFCTGFRTQWELRPEFGSIAPHILTWKDVYPVPPGEPDAELDESPYLGGAFELRQKTAGTCPGLERIHVFCYGATLTHGGGAGDIPQISEGAQRLALGLVAALATADVATHYDALRAFADPELNGDEWRAEPLPDYVAEAASTESLDQT